MWTATDIVVATEGAEVDGRFTVLERWKGEAKPGDEIVLPDLAEFAPAESRRIYEFGTKPTNAVVTGDRMILFLVRDTAADAQQAPGVAKTVSYYKSEGFEISVAWVEDGDVFAIQQIINPGPSVLTRLGSNETELHAAIAGFCVMDEALKNAVAERKPTQIKQAFRAFERRNHHYASLAAIKALAELGDDAIPAFREMLGDVTLMGWHDKLIKALVRRTRTKCRPFAEVLERECWYWSKMAEELAAGKGAAGAGALRGSTRRAVPRLEYPRGARRGAGSSVGKS